ncbi:MAG: endonuclease-8 [Gammaproteobacteria bacterium]|jgi:endonuclease-8
MPEGPEIRIAADRIARVLAGERIEEIVLAPPPLQRFKPLLQGQIVTRVDTHGKAMLTRFDNGLTMYSHNQLYGRWYVCARGEVPDTGRALRIALHTASHSALLYSATDIDVLDAGQLSTHPFLCRLGPDILDASLHWQALAARLQLTRFRGRSLASLYLDQGFVAGIGNYLRSEILHFAKLHHSRRPKDLDGAQCQRLAKQTLLIARRSYSDHGVTNTAARVRQRKAAGDTRRAAFRFAVFARDGEPCDACGAEIERADAGSRRIYYCPKCQP